MPPLAMWAGREGQNLGGGVRVVTAEEKAAIVAVAAGTVER